MFKEIIIKMKLKKELTREIYSNLSYDIQTDSRIISHLIKCDPKLISIVPSEVDVSSFVSENYDLIHYLTSEQLNECIKVIDISKINVTRELFEKLNSDKQISVFKNFPTKCIEYYDDKTKREVIKGVVLAKFAITEHDILENRHLNRYSSCKDIPEEELKKIILNLSEEEFYNLFSSKLIVQKYIIDLFSSFDDKEVDNNFHLLKTIYTNLPQNLKNKVDIKDAGDNLEKVVQLSEDLQIAYFLQNINKLSYASEKIQTKCLMQLENLTADILLKHNMTYHPSYILKLSTLEQEKVFSRNFERIFYVTNSINYELDLDSVMYNRLSQIYDVDKRNKLLELYNTLDEEKHIKRSDDYIYHREKYQISRLLYDKNIVNNNSAEILIKYKETYDKNLLIQILANAYGEHILEIFSDRPNLDLLYIDNFKIFDRRIYEKLGKNFIHHLLNCELYILDDLIGKITEDEKILNNFVDYFKCITNDLENLDLNTITNIMEKYIVHEEIINKLDFNNINETTKENLKLLINDSIMLSIGAQSISDLNNYIEIRKRRYVEIANEVEEPSEIKNLIYAFVFGRSVSQDRLVVSKDDQLEKLSFEKALRIFNIENLISNKEIINKMGLNQSEIDMLLLLHEINNIRDVNILRNTYISLVNENLNSVLFSNTFNKIKNFYIEDIRNGLLSTSKLETMEKNNVDGVEVVTFNGDEFTLICSVTGLNLSETEGRIEQKNGEELLKDWITRENGTSIISTALVSSDTSIYPIEERLWENISGGIVFVFDNDINIIGMGASDIMSEHRKRSVIHSFDHIGISGRDHGFSTMDELKIRVNRNNKMQFQTDHFESEITIARREEDIRKNGGGLKRTMPIAMYVIGEITPKHLETAKAFNEYYEKNGLGKFRIIQVDPRFYKGEGRIVGSEFKQKGDENVGEVSDKILKVLEVMKESIKVYTPENEEEIERLNKIKDYIEQQED